MYPNNYVQQIRERFAKLFTIKDFVTDKTGVKTLEIVAAQFVADDKSIFGKIKQSYLDQELDWYLSLSRNINDMNGEVPTLWKSTAGPNGETNSNYGWCVFSEENHTQYYSVYKELKKNPDSRRAIMIYTRPTMHKDYCENGKSDFICTNNVQYFIRNNHLCALVNMRSNDAVFGYKADFYWQDYVLDRLYNELKKHYTSLYKGDIIWNAGSLHIYERHFPLVEKYIRTGEY